MKRKWWIGSKIKRFRHRLGEWLWPYIPQPHWLRKWYYRKSYEWWGHPSNHHWKGWLFEGDCEEGKGPRISLLLPGERDIWGGGYCDGENENEQENDRRIC